jgi:glucokinase
MPSPPETGSPAGPVLVLDIGATKTIVASVDRAPENGFQPLRPPVRFATPRDAGAFLAALEEGAAKALPQGTAPAAVGIGVPGPLDAARGIVLHSTNLGWRSLPLGDMVSGLFGHVPVAMDDDSNTGALGEAFGGAGRGADPFVYLPLGTGLGSGIIVDGRIVGGAHGAAGEVGHMAVGDRIGPRCNCGRHNCVEAWCSGIGLARRARETWPAARLPDGSRAPRDAEGVFAMARRGDPAAEELVGRARHALAIALAALMSSLDPAAVSVGGSLGAAEPGFVRDAFREATRLIHWATGRRVRLRRPLLADASVIAGAAVLGMRAAREAADGPPAAASSGAPAVGRGGASSLPERAGPDRT